MIQQPTVRRLGLVLIALVIAFFIPFFITAAQEEIPPIPHQLERREDCLGCHEEGKLGSPMIPEDHAGRTNDVCQECHRPEGEAPLVIPAIPHTLENRENCLECHKPSEMSGEAEVEIEDRPPPLPTPIAHPQATGEVDNCVECHSTLEEGQHAEIVTQSLRSIHNERNVSCADCHGGDPSATTQEEAKSAQANYVGVPAKADIPALCASCHANVTQMRQYNLPTDQYAKYQESIHGIRLEEGDENVATCFDCHGGHQILKANDPASTVYSPNVPAMCASCHADEELMAPYDIPTNQFALYKQSVHGHALLDNHDLRAPDCATCHGTHGAAPPGFEEVANVCGSCHAATQDYFLESPHAGDDDVGPKCVTCHGRYDVTKPSEALYLGTEPRHCGECHEPDSEAGQTVQALYDTITDAAEAYEAAEAAIQDARDVGMLVSPLEGRLRQANTDLVTARAAQHTLDLELVSARADDARAIAEEVKASAEEAIAHNIFRRRAMVIAVAVIALTIVALYMLKRELDRQLAEEEPS